MKNLILILIFSIYALFLMGQPKLIFDTDFGGDADDLGALAMLHNYIDKKQCDLLAIMSWSDEKYAVAGIDAVNRFYNHPNIPIGSREVAPKRLERCYGEVIASNFYHELNNENTHEATRLYRQILENSEDNSIIIVTVGPLKNIENLLYSKRDDISCKSGKQLVKRKVKEFVIMGGKYPETKWEWNFNGGMKGVTKNVLDMISVPITFVGAELGGPLKTGEIFNAIDHNTPLYKGFMHFSEYAPWINKDFNGEILDNSTFDQLAVLYAVENRVGEYWNKIYGEYCVADNDGGNQWVQKRRSEHAYLVYNIGLDSMATAIENLMIDNDKTRLKKE